MTDQLTESRMTKDEARECIEQINENLRDTRELLLELYEREGWKALNYSSWRECVTGEFKEKQAYLYYQLAAAKTERNISTIVEKSEPLPESHLREISKIKDPDQQREVYRQAVETAPEGKVTARHIEETVKEMKEAKAPEAPPEPPKEEKPKAAPVIIAEEFLTAYAEMRKVIVKAQQDKWTTTTRTEAEKFIGRLLEMVNREGE